MATLTAQRRKNIPKSEMGLPGNATKKGGAAPGTYPMPDRQHAIEAKSGAARAERVGNISKAQEQRIDAKADRILNGGAGDHARALHEKGKAQAAAVMNKRK